MINFNKLLNEKEEEIIENENGLKWISKIEDGKHIEYYTKEEINATCLYPKLPIKYFVNYLHNFKEGEGNYFYPNGKKEIKAFFEKDKKVKTWIFYDKDGIIQETIEFKNDLKEGNYKYYNGKELIKHFIYEKNQIKEIIRGEINDK